MMSTTGSLVLVLVLAVLVVLVVQAKVFNRCELARELRDRHGLPHSQLATWVCIARFESDYNTKAVGNMNTDGSKDHGLFQINDRYWCSPPNKGKGCGVTCRRFEDNDISDDVKCIRRIYNEHKGISGDGFTAWTVYHRSCSGGRAARFIDGCF